MTRHETAPLQPVLLGLRIALHLMVVSLTVFVAVRTILQPGESSSWVLALAIVLLVSYLGGAALLRRGPRAADRTIADPISAGPTSVGPTSRVGSTAWLAVVSLEILGLAVLTPDAAFLVFPLFFLQLHILQARWAVPAIALSTVVTIAALSAHDDWTIGGVIGPVIGASVAVVIGLGYRALYRETRERQELIDELLTTRAELAAREREAGVLEERSRLAREIHDTVAQGLSSIQLLLHAAERGGAKGGVLDQVRLARETAGVNLAEARRFIRELTPPALDGQTLVDALSRLAAAASRGGLAANLHLSGTPRTLAMPLETTLLRIAQASLANVSQHASATHAEITITYLEDWVGLDVVDDGGGFNPKNADRRGSFGLIALRERIEGLGGTLSIESRPGAGTAIAAAFSLGEGES